MRVLWIVNILLPEAESLLTGKGELKASGGWLIGSAKALVNKECIRLYIACVSKKVDEMVFLEGQEITYIVIPFGRGNERVNHDYEKYWKIVKEKIKPDIIHLHGSEFSHGLAWVEACGNKNVVLSIQGMKSAYYYYYYGLTKSEIIKNMTIRDFLLGGILSGQKRYKRSGEYEKAVIKRVEHIIGRTLWDRAHTWEINPLAKYHFCNETLRPEFYGGDTWNYDKCKKHSIFLSQAGSPIKGLHQLIKAMPIILRHFPDTTVRIGGTNIVEPKKMYGIELLTGFGKIIRNMIKDFRIESHVEFLGNLNAEDMKREYLNANVFICPSSIENSPNSLGEAQILGVPCIASYVGGVPDMMKGDETHLFRFEETSMLAYAVCECFNKGENEDTTKMIHAAKIRHSREENVNRLLEIYNEIIADD